jgi:hypothetical protein
MNLLLDVLNMFCIFFSLSTLFSTCDNSSCVDAMGKATSIETNR